MIPFFSTMESIPDSFFMSNHMVYLKSIKIKFTKLCLKCQLNFIPWNSKLCKSQIFYQFKSKYFIVPASLKNAGPLQSNGSWRMLNLNLTGGRHRLTCSATSCMQIELMWPPHAYTIRWRRVTLHMRNSHVQFACNNFMNSKKLGHIWKFFIFQNISYS